MYETQEQQNRISGKVYKLQYFTSNFHIIIAAFWETGFLPQSQKDPIIIMIYGKQQGKQSVETTVIKLSWLITLELFSHIWHYILFNTSSVCENSHRPLIQNLDLTYLAKVLCSITTMVGVYISLPCGFSYTCNRAEADLVMWIYTW